MRGRDPERAREGVQKKEGWKRKVEGKRREVLKTSETRNFYQNHFFYKIFIFGAPVSTFLPQSVSNFARKCGPAVHTFMPNFIVIGRYNNI